MKDTLTECELVVMKIIWESEEALSIQDILAQLDQVYHKTWKIQTVSTFLSRAAKKGYLEMRRQGRQFFYYPLVSEEEYGKKEITKCVNFWGNGKVDALLASFAKVRTFTKDEKERIRNLLDDMD